jgi:hypothetical protein
MNPEQPPAAPGTDPAEAAPPLKEADREGVRQQREHIEALDGEDPLRGGVAD